MAATVLVVEDEPNIGELLRTYLQRDGHRVIWVRRGEDALVELRRHPIKLVLLDIRLPGIDGFEVCRRIGGSVPVIMLTARDEEADRVAGLELGADDYVTKPFSPRELMARVKAVLRRAAAQPVADDVSRAGPMTLARGAREVHVDGRKVTLTQREFDLLEYLLRRAGRWSPATSCSSRYGASSPRARRARSRSTSPSCARSSVIPDLIETVRGLGYKMAAAG